MFALSLWSFLPSLDVWTYALQAVGTIVGTVLALRIIKPDDAKRAELLARIANDAAALVVAMYPTKPWADMLRLVIEAITKAAGVPTKNAAAIERAAASALERARASAGVK